MAFIPSFPGEKPPRVQWKTKLLAVLFLMGFAGVLTRLFFVQVLQAESYQERARRQYDSRIELRPERGTILDRNGKVIASTIQSTSIAVDPTVLKNVKQVSQLLEQATGEPAKEYQKKITSSKNSFVWLARSILGLKSDLLDTIQDRGLLRYHEPRRNFVYGSVAAQVIGATNVDNKGVSGVELGQDSLLAGTGGFQLMQRDGRGKLHPAVSAPVTQAQNGRTVVLTLDMDIQSVVEFELQQGITQSQAASGTAVAINPRTGEILAMASYPTFDPNNMQTATTDGMRIRSITDMYEPGSTFKLVTAAAALEEKLISPRDTVDAHGGVLKIADMTITDAHPLGRTTFLKSMEQSSNIVFAELARKMTNDKFYKYVRDFGFGIPLGIDLPGEVSGKIKKPKQFDGTTKMYMSYGYELGATALQIASAYATIANGGEMMKPYLVKEIRNDDGDELEIYKPQKIRQVVSKETADILKEMLTGVVERGTGTEAKLPGIRIAGKTGTAQQLVDGKYSKEAYTASFAGFFPADDPEIALVVMLDRPQTNIYGGKTAAPIFKNIVQRLASSGLISGVSKPQMVEHLLKDSVSVPDVRGLTKESATEILHRTGLRLKTDNNDGVIQSQKPAPGTFLLKGTNVAVQIRPIAKTPVENVALKSEKPDVRGMSARRALALIHGAGFKAKVFGSGVVVKQTWEGGTCVIECQ
jgi:cell division protein FtsI (penicillin-binding protein 3)